MRKRFSFLASFLIVVCLTAVFCGHAWSAPATLKVSGIEAPNIVHRAETLTDLRGMTGTPGRQAVYLEGRTTRGDGGEGNFRWDSSDLSAEVTADTQSGIYVAPDSDATGASGCWVRVDNNPLDARWFGAVADRTTDNTSAIIAAAKWYGDNGFVRGQVYLAPNIKYNWNALMDSADVPLGVVFDDKTSINVGYEKSAKIGFFEKGDPLAEYDTSTVFGSGHNASITLDNSGKSGSDSGQKRMAAISWGAGRFDKGAIENYPRSAGRLEFAKSNSYSDRWAMVLRKRAPWLAIENNYFRWDTGVAVTIGEYCFSSANNQYYKATSSGTTGETAPTHDVGSVSDGGVSWEAVAFRYDATVLYVDDLGRISTNSSKPSTVTWNFEQDPNDTDTARLAIHAAGTSRFTELQMVPTDSSGDDVAVAKLRADESSGLYVVDAGSTKTLVSFNDNAMVLGPVQRGFAYIPAGTTMPSVVGKSMLVTQNSSPTTITGFSGSSGNEEVRLYINDTNTTLHHGSGLRLSGSVDITPTQHSIITFVRVSSISSSFVEVSRSIK